LNADELERSLVSERTGPVSFVAEVPMGPGAPSFYAYSAVVIAGMQFPRPHRLICGGIALSCEQAKAIALVEAVERYCSATWDPGSLVFGTYRTLVQSFPLLPPAAYALFHPAQFPGVGYQPFTENTPLRWIWGCSLTRRTPILAPACLVYTGYEFSATDEAIIGPATTSGAACGETYTFALLRAVCEVVERDALMITWWNRWPRSRVEMSPGSWIHQVCHERLQRPGLEYTLLDVSTDVPIIVLMCVLIDCYRLRPMPIFGSAAGFDAEHVALKALLEAAALHRCLSRARSPRRLNRPDDVRFLADHVDFYAFGNREAALQFLTRSQVPISLDELPNYETSTPEQQLARCIATMRELGLDLIAIDLTRDVAADVGLKVVKVLIPQLIPISFGHQRRCLGGSRLYDVPVKLGFRKTPCAMYELNPDPHPFG